jgi:hypothetical protein
MFFFFSKKQPNEIRGGKKRDLGKAAIRHYCQLMCT